MKYLTDTGLANLRAYQYRGSNGSLLYKHVLRPFAERCLGLVPLWLAPNAITLLGLAFPLLGFVLTAGCCPTLTEAAPRLLYVYQAWALLFYQTMDNLDGLQARRTGSSSPLGQLFDHGCDAVNVTISATTLAAALQLGLQWALLLLAVAQGVFFLTTWDEYHTKELLLGLINGADDGVTLTYLLYGATALLGPGLWLQPLLGLALGRWLVLAVAGAGLATVAGFVQRVEAATRPAVGPALWRLGPLGLLLAYAAGAAAVPELLGPQAMPLCVLLAGVFAHITCSLIMAHVTHAAYHVAQLGLAPLLLPLLNAGLGLVASPPLDPGLAVGAAAVCSVGLLLHYAVGCVGQITQALGIRCFHIQPPLPM